MALILIAQLIALCHYAYNKVFTIQIGFEVVALGTIAIALLFT